MIYDTTSTGSTGVGLIGWFMVADVYDDNYPAGRCDFLHVLLDGHYLEHPFIVLPVRAATPAGILWVRKTVKSITGPGRSYRGGRRK